MSDERRQIPRRPLELKIRVDGPQATQHLTARDLTGAGAFVETPRPIAIGQMLECRLELPGQDGAPAERVNLTAEVRHHAKAYKTDDGQGPFRGMGLRFVRIDLDAQAKLVRFVRRRDPSLTTEDVNG